MSTTTHLELDDGTPIRFVLAPGEGTADPARDADLPEGIGRVVPVGSGRRAVASFAAEALRGALKPLGPLLQEVHDAALSAPRPPTELSVTFGVQVGQDLKLGIVGGNGQAHLTVTASWKPTEAAGRAPDAG